MQKRPIRLNEPVLVQKRKPIKKKKSKTAATYERTKKQREINRKKIELGLIDDMPKYLIPQTYMKSWSEFTDEEKKRKVQIVINFNNRKKAKSPRFKKYMNRIIVGVHRRKTGRTKVCTVCKKELPENYFDILGVGDYKKKKRNEHPLTDKNRRRPYCMYCKREMNKEYYRKNKEKWEGINDLRRIREEKQIQASNGEGDKGQKQG